MCQNNELKVIIFSTSLFFMIHCGGGNVFSPSESGQINQATDTQGNGDNSSDSNLNNKNSNNTNNSTVGNSQTITPQACSDSTNVTWSNCIQSLLIGSQSVGHCDTCHYNGGSPPALTNQSQIQTNFTSISNEINQGVMPSDDPGSITNPQKKLLQTWMVLKFP